MLGRGKAKENSNKMGDEVSSSCLRSEGANCKFQLLKTFFSFSLLE
jgi:hypothetical protein